MKVREMCQFHSFVDNQLIKLLWPQSVWITAYCVSHGLFVGHAEAVDLLIGSHLATNYCGLNQYGLLLTGIYSLDYCSLCVTRAVV